MISAALHRRSCTIRAASILPEPRSTQNELQDVRAITRRDTLGAHAPFLLVRTISSGQVQLSFKSDRNNGWTRRRN
jgi:hypothetical protein